ncbi:hypothetical protein BK119_08985 [Paenibacillus peoriae]|nr:hypothetical protein BK119_08985 [Paenibacillus peoriae]
MSFYKIVTRINYKKHCKGLNAIALLENGASNRVIQKNNFKFVGEIEIDDEIYNHYKIHKIDF